VDIKQKDRNYYDELFSNLKDQLLHFEGLFHINIIDLSNSKTTHRNNSYLFVLYPPNDGGAAKAVLAILNQAIANEKDPIYEVLKNAKFHLVDIFKCFLNSTTF
jgi:hypothetical protein